MAVTSAVRYEQEIGDILEQLGGVHKAVAKHGLDPRIIHLVEMRASQINQCGFCIKMHSAEARDAGETNERLDRVIVWRHVRDFNDKEKAALAWTEALTHLDPKTEYAPLRAELKVHFSDKEISVLTTVVCMINLWNRFQISKH
ncbi:carboxymuconolactone decarboxylase family protein [Kiloniella sp.]|uniref:carboxymuconolactone decarboxylase family protein n=1 Tax=Kiloniella sp. TaxID=1938587 RepID=UPI003B0162DE